MNNSPIENAFVNSKTQYYKVLLPAGAKTFIIGTNRNRIALHFYTLSGNIASVLPDNNPAVDMGIPVSNFYPITITQWQHGDLATNNWFGVCAVDCWLVVVEVVADCPCPTGH